MKDIGEEGTRRPPSHLRDSSYAGAAEMGHGEGYRYPHDYPEGRVRQNYFPQGMEDRRYYHPSGRGFEQELERRLKEIRDVSKPEDGES